MYDAKAKGLFVKNIKKVHGIATQKSVLYLIKSMKNGSQMKSFQSKCKQIGKGSYMFIFTNEISHLTSY